MDERDDGRDPARAALRHDSDRLLRAVEELRALEKEKRGLEISTPPFHEAARRVEEKAREVFRIAEQQERHGRQAEPDDDFESIEDQPRPEEVAE